MVASQTRNALQARNVDTIGADLLTIRRAIDPLDDSFRVLGAPDQVLPPMTADWVDQLQTRVNDNLTALSAMPVAEEDIAWAVAMHLAKDTSQRLSMALWATFVSGYDHSPLGRITGLFPSLPIQTERDEAFMLDALASISDYITGCHKAGVRAARTGREPLRRSLDQAVRRWQDLLGDPGETLAPAGATAAQKTRFTDHFNAYAAPAVRAYVDWLATTARSVARPDTRPGLCHIANGEADYIALVATHTDDFGTVDDIHAFGLSEINRLHKTLAELTGEARYYPISELLRFPVPGQPYGSEVAFKAAMKALIETATTTFAKTLNLGAVRQLQLATIPSHMSETSPPAYYVPGSQDNLGQLMLNVQNMAAQTIGSADAMFFHEAIPGHHVQFEIARQLALPEYRKTAWMNAYIEGWGLYCEELAAEAGLYKNLAAKRGKLTMELLRAARLVVDTGLHAKGWSIARASAYLMQTCGLSAQSAEAEMMRYTEYPAQALSYATGKARLLCIRANTTTAMGAAFDEKVFHDTLLNCGPVPLDSLERYVERKLGGITVKGKF